MCLWRWGINKLVLYSLPLAIALNLNKGFEYTTTLAAATVYRRSGRTRDNWQMEQLLWQLPYRVNAFLLRKVSPVFRLRYSEILYKYGPLSRFLLTIAPSVSFCSFFVLLLERGEMSSIQWLCCFVDPESCFEISIAPDPKNTVGTSDFDNWVPHLVIDMDERCCMPSGWGVLEGRDRESWRGSSPDGDWIITATTLTRMGDGCLWVCEQ